VAGSSTRVLDMSRSVDELQRQLIAERLGLRPEEITTEFMDRYLEEKVYPTVRFETGSALGGYDNSHLRVLTRTEFEEIRREADELFEHAARTASK